MSRFLFSGKAAQMLVMIEGIMQILLLCLPNPLRALLTQEQNQICCMLICKKEAWKSSMILHFFLFFLSDWLTFPPAHFFSSSLCSHGKQHCSSKSANRFVFLF